MKRDWEADLIKILAIVAAVPRWVDALMKGDWGLTQSRKCAIISLSRGIGAFLFANIEPSLCNVSIPLDKD